MDIRKIKLMVKQFETEYVSYEELYLAYWLVVRIKDVREML